MLNINVLIKPASGLCNMNCDYCFYKDEMKNREQASFGYMSEATLKNVIRKTLPRAIYSEGYAFQGGEPTLRGLDFFRKVIEYEKQYNRNNIIVNNFLQTNGSLIDEDWCEFLQENNFLVGLSIDGIKEIHDKYRHLNGAGSYDSVIKAAELFNN